MKRAVARVDREVRDLQALTLSLTVADCEGDQVLYAQVVAALREAIVLIELRSKYLKKVPWNFVQADTVDGTLQFLQGATSRPLAQQDELTQYLYYTHCADLQTRSVGGPCSPALADEVSVVDESPLDESAGEGYHRGTHLTRIRGRNSSAAHIKASTRLNQNLGHLRSWLARGKLGKRVLRYEWRQWKRVLQVQKNQQWRSKHMKAQAVFERFYHMDAKAEENWSLICETKPAPGQGPVPQDLQVVASVQDRALAPMRIEYLHAVLVPKRWYSVQVPVAASDDSGEPTVRMEQRNFQLVSVASTKSRPKLMPTIDSYQDPVVVSQLALNIQETSVRVLPEVADGSVVVYPDAAPRWINWTDLGPWREGSHDTPLLSGGAGIAGERRLFTVVVCSARPPHPPN